MTFKAAVSRTDMYVFNESEIMEYETENANGFLLPDTSIAIKKIEREQENARDHIQRLQSLLSGK